MIGAAKLCKKTLGEASTCNLGPVSQTSEVKLSASLNATLLIPGTIDCSTFQESRMMNYDMDCVKTVKFNSFGLEQKVATSVFDIYVGGRRKKADSDSDFSPDKKSRKKSLKRKNAKRRRGENRTDEEKAKKKKLNLKRPARTEKQKAAQCTTIARAKRRKVRPPRTEKQKATRVARTEEQKATRPARTEEQKAS